MNRSDFSEWVYSMTSNVLTDQFLNAAIAQANAQIGWAADLPDDPTTFFVGASETAFQFQQAIAKIDTFGGWAASHMCMMETMFRLHDQLPCRYLEIGVNEGYSLLAMITSLRLQRLLFNPREILAPLFDELVLADVWGRQYGGTGRGSHRHIENVLRSNSVDLGNVRFLDGDSKKTIPAFLASRMSTTPFDVIYVDGDHSYSGAKTDLENVLPHVGKVLFFDDMYHPAHCVKDRLLELHRMMVERLKNEYYAFLNRRGFGFAVFIRRHVFDALR